MLKISPDSHLDHGLSPEHVAWLQRRFADREGFFLETVKLPRHLAPLACGIHGPIMGDAPVPDAEVQMEVRGARAGLSRLCGRLPRPTRLCTVVAGPDGAEPCVLYTAYGGPAAPREPWSVPREASAEEHMAAADFWSKHALSR